MGSVMEILNSHNTHKTAQAKIDAARVVQTAFNEKEAATTSLATFSQALQNQRKMEAQGAEYNAQTENLGTALDQAATGTFVQRIQAASQVGAATAMAAAGGVGGSTVESYRRTLEVQAAIQDENTGRAVSTSNIRATQRKSSIIQDAVASLGNESFAPNFDYTIYLDHVKQKNKIGAAIAVGVASYFGGPQAGQATADAIASGNRAANQDNIGANQLMNSAGANAVKGYEYYKANRVPEPPADKGGAKVSGDNGFGFKMSENNSSGFWGSGGGESSGGGSGFSGGGDSFSSW